ncbi:3-isopropylmalate dehydratase [Synechocystis sp. PCC 6803]|jgi:3-isopropylmalate/(R)-2-methylmalate dehydratase small subunit|uniref:3-isopropylmalate dehydratase small subunit n=1 Tax=Synechocystis sp. (strain ATCC 27184 / PCC 6803 / Kazusa) TaxID=1111708 RepID=LEUD_SYNY3|nr:MULTISPECIES: 3-isopropylmalate dehydratase small subunit [unclassified Synechocystis]P74207.1 RecName: Full=3-isopropylmalate dehydratase small subunit; AltName: Full=Alpha-IPM isomerase; Short=IPMI; AltName: Full=Isopropylmalate isomerase [Synechocystis sp. PCC 6803 substr. Kazusa]BAM54991.1 isopropylmalate isomerase small subunit [Synechocystis sp. PCC 6803] [Bacillus subtilis BEST7613]AGF51986.1 3-isopropylmalate dehydratase [Synechocystis sp. PCC 6803]ALJ67950.1 isopropylmalate isomeras
MSQVKQIQGKALPLVGDDIDTDRIIPARFLRCVTFDGLGEHVFADDRQQQGGNHPFDLSQYQDATVLVVNRNFGCGSSREHAPQAIIKWGIKAIIGESFAEIFLGNCLANGVPCVTAPHGQIADLQQAITADPNLAVNLDLTTAAVTYGDRSFPVILSDGAQQMLLDGQWDTCGQLVQNQGKIAATAEKLPYLHWQTSAA